MSDESVSMAVLRAVADREGVDLDELRPPLYHTINPESLDALFRDGTGEVRFTYLGYDVTVSQGGSVHLSRPDRSSDE